MLRDALEQEFAIEPISISSACVQASVVALCPGILNLKGTLLKFSVVPLERES